MSTDKRIAADFEPILAQLASMPPIPSGTVESARAMSEAMDFGTAEAVAEVRELSLEGADGPIAARLYVPDAPRALVIFYHGGGWVVGSLRTYDKSCRGLARRAGCAVLSVDYRLAPEHRFPAAVDDALAALRWARARRAELPCPDGPLIVAGDSAGGNLAAAVSLLARDDPEGGVDGQFLIYPVTDAPHDGGSHRDRAEGGLLTAADVQWFHGHYAPDPALRDDPRLAVSRAANLAGLPPAVVITAEFDPLRDEGLAYADALAASGVAVVRRHFDAQPHGFMPFFQVIPSAGTAFEELAAMLRGLIDEAARG